MKALHLDAPLAGGTTWAGREEHGHVYHGFLGYTSPLMDGGAE